MSHVLTTMPDLPIVLLHCKDHVRTGRSVNAEKALTIDVLRHAVELVEAPKGVCVFEEIRERNEAGEIVKRTRGILLSCVGESDISQRVYAQPLPAPDDVPAPAPTVPSGPGLAKTKG